MATAEQSEAFKRGWLAAESSVDFSDNPYESGSAEAVDWGDGWLAWRLVHGPDPGDPQTFRSGQ